MFGLNLRTGVRVACLVMSLLFVGCQHSYEEKKIGQARPPLLSSTTRVYIGRPFDATFKKRVVHNSGKSVAEALLVAFNRNTKAAAMSRRPQSPEDALTAARDYRAEYMIYPIIIRWEDRATEASGLRDKLEFRLDLYDVEGGGVIFSRVIHAKSRWMTDGGDSPVDLLQQPIDNFVQMLFRVDNPAL